MRKKFDVFFDTMPFDERLVFIKTLTISIVRNKQRLNCAITATAMTRGGLRAGHCRNVELLGRGRYIQNNTTPAFGYIVCYG